MSLVNSIVAYEEGSLDQEGTVQLFQRLIDSGEIWHLQGSYQRTAQALLSSGECVR